MEHDGFGEAGWVDAVLAGWRQGQHLSAVGPGPVEVHLHHARGLAALIGPGPLRCLDLGTGAGIPGLALAGLLPETTWTLVDAARRRTRVLQSVVDAVGWAGRVTVIHERGETLGRDPGHSQRYHVVTARLFGPPAVTAEVAAPFVRPGDGRVIVSEPQEAGPERWPADAMRPLGLAPGPRSADPAAQVLRAVGPPEDRFPRKPGTAVKRPLW